MISKAAMSVLSGMVAGAELSQIESLKKEDILKALGLEEIAAGRLRCLMLGLKAVQSMVAEQGESESLQS